MTLADRVTHHRSQEITMNMITFSDPVILLRESSQ